MSTLGMGFLDADADADENNIYLQGKGIETGHHTYLCRVPSTMWRSTHIIMFGKFHSMVNLDDCYFFTSIAKVTYFKTQSVGYYILMIKIFNLWEYLTSDVHR